MIRFSYLIVLSAFFTLSGCMVVPANPVYVQPRAVVVAPAPVYVAPPVTTAVVVTRPLGPRIFVARY